MPTTPRYAVSAGDEQAKGIGTEEAEIDPMNYPIRRRKRTDTPHAKAPVGAAMENGDPNAMIFTPNSEGFQRVMFDKVCVYIRVGSPEDVDEVKVNCSEVEQLGFVLIVLDAGCNQPATRRIRRSWSNCQQGGEQTQPRVGSKDAGGDLQSTFVKHTTLPKRALM